MTAVISVPFYHDKGTCGYCQHRTPSSTRTRTSTRTNSGRHSRIYCFTAHTLPVELYGTLMDMGFRRSGTFVYKPDVVNSCCPQYTIRLAVDSVKVSKEQRKALRRFTRWACGGEAGAQGRAFDLSYEVHLADRDWPVPDPVTSKGFKPLVYRTCRPDFVVRVTPATFSQDKYELYRRYQMEVHGDTADKVTEAGFKRFLCSNPFTSPVKVNGDGTVDLAALKKTGGAVHQGYYHNGKLMALAVLDVVPFHCLSSVYLIYDPSFAWLDLGKVSALREIVLARDLGLPHYYMGLYIFGCSKMAYKGQFQPSELLDPQSAHLVPDWVPLEVLQKELDEHMYATMDERRKRPEEEVVVGEDNADAPSRLFKLELPGALSYTEVRSTDYLGMKVMLPFPRAPERHPTTNNDSDSDSDDDYDYTNGLTMPLVEFRSRFDVPVVETVAMELRAMVGARTSHEFVIALR